MNQSRSELPRPLPVSVLGDGTERYDVVVIGFGIVGGSAAPLWRALAWAYGLLFVLFALTACAKT